ncbi:hypothetical protein HHI36_003100 [Cryptolaemus montrouzieri]|uniref:Uncharacterized protein n=1 Tax=Cryptolaemus montrouzieri TaxID=559131 RepID=A0ABD2PCI0_9CUCU
MEVDGSSHLIGDSFGPQTGVGRYSLEPSSKVLLAAGISVAEITELFTQAELPKVDCSSAVDEDGVIASSGSASVEAVLVIQLLPLVAGPDVPVEISDGPFTVIDITDLES